MTNVIIEEIVRDYCKQFGIPCPLDIDDRIDSPANSGEGDPPVYPSAPIEEIPAGSTEEYHNLLALDALAWTYDKTIFDTIDRDYLELHLSDSDLQAIATDLDDTDWAL